MPLTRVGELLARGGEGAARNFIAEQNLQLKRDANEALNNWRMTKLEETIRHQKAVDSINQQLADADTADVASKSEKRGAETTGLEQENVIRQWTIDKQRQWKEIDMFEIPVMEEAETRSLAGKVLGNILGPRMSMMAGVGPLVSQVTTRSTTKRQVEESMQNVKPVVDFIAKTGEYSALQLPKGQAARLSMEMVKKVLQNPENYGFTERDQQWLDKINKTLVQYTMSLSPRVLRPTDQQVDQQTEPTQ